MAQPKISAIRCIEFDVPDLEQSARYYEEAWGLAPVARDGGSCYLRATGPEHHAVVLHENASSALAAIGFAAPDKAAVDALHARVQGQGVAVVSPPAPIERPGAGYGFSFLHADGWKFAVSSDVETHADTEDAIDRPRRFSHLALGSEQAEEASAFMVDTFGFRISDRNDVINFLRCDADHHSLAFVHKGPPFVHHVSYEMPSLEAMNRSIERMKEMGYPLEWGVGRHGPGDNIFCFFLDPHGFLNEYSVEMHQVDEATYETGTPEQWRKHAESSEPWGNTDPPSEAMRKAHQSPTLLPAA